MAAFGTDKEKWFLDSCIMGNQNLLSDFGPSHDPSIRIVGSQIMLVVGKGSIKISNTTRKIKVVTDVLYVPGVHTNLFSMEKFIDLGYRIIFNKQKCYILDKEQPSNIYFQAIRDYGKKLYKIENGAHQLSLAVLPLDPRSSIALAPIPKVHQSPLHDQPALKSISSTKRSLRPSFTDVHLWHHWISHINFQSLYYMTSQGLVTSTPALPLIKHMCISYVMGKMHKDRVPKVRTTPTTRPFQLIHSDLCCPLSTTSKTGSKYILTFIDDYTCKTWLYFLAKKS